MLRFSANISMLFTERPFPERFAAAREAGFRAVEMQFPYDIDLDELVRARRRAGVDVVLINIPGGDQEAGDRGLAALPDRVQPFRASVPLARVYAEALGCRRVNALAGIPRPQDSKDECFETLAENLAFAAAEMDRAGIRVLTEPINTRDTPGFFLSDSTAALDVIDHAGHPNLALQYDVYHMTVMGEDVPTALRQRGRRIGHIQFADAPGRHEPGSGDIDFAAVFAAIDAIGYQSWCGAEYVPSRATAETLAWLRRATS